MSCLYMTSALVGERTQLVDSYFTQPFKITKPFYQGDTMKIIAMAATAGVLKDDFYDIQVKVGAGSKLVLTNQSYTKIFNTQDGEAKQSFQVTVEEGASFANLMQPSIPFANSAFLSRSQVTVGKNSRLFWTDIISCGRVAMKEKFGFRKYHNRLEVRDEEGKLLFLDNLYLCPEDADQSGIGYYEGHTHVGTIFLYGYSKPKLPETQRLEVAITEGVAGYIIRMSGNSADVMYKYASLVYDEISKI